jgi:predicted nucleic acid-binding protein
MTYLLDVNALVALGFQQHEFHTRVVSWIARAKEPMLLATCSITELGFARILAQAPIYGLSVAQARSLLLRLKKRVPSRFTFISDSCDLSHLPDWAYTPKRITDGHLAQLAKASGAVLATLDAGIPSVFLIPQR